MRKKSIVLEDAVTELGQKVSDAVNFLSTEFEPGWEVAERYYNGETDLDYTLGRSNVVKTEVRDAIRNTMPSIMRVLLQARKIVEYIPSHPLHADWVEQQSEFVTQRFWASDGYLQLYSAIDEATRLRYGPVKTYWEQNSKPRYFKYTKAPSTLVRELTEAPDIEISSIVEAQTDQDIPLYDIEGYQLFENGKIVFQSVPAYEFFIDEYSSSIQEAVKSGVHGHRREVTVGEAIEMGIEYDDWDTLDTDDPETGEFDASSQERRGYAQSGKPRNKDPMAHTFLLTEVYAQYNLETKQAPPRLYRFILGGTNYVYLDHEEIEESPFDLVRLSLKAHTIAGPSLADITINEQDTSTSLLRATVDNAHASNNPRHAADPKRTSFDDLMNNAIGAPIRTRGDAIQTVSIPFTGQGLLGLLQYLDQDVQNKVGVTKAAQGLDPDAMQSTDKQAVMNTIMTSQGQVELMVRNIIEGALISVFRKFLRLSIQHFAPNQVLLTKGKVIPISLRSFDPNLTARPNVGLGTASPAMKQQGLMFALQKQEGYMQQMGMNNPFTSYTQVYNTLEDLMELFGIYDIGRYFKVVTPQVEQELAKLQQQQRQQAEQNAPTDPIKGMMAIESLKSRVKHMELIQNHTDHQSELAYKATKDGAELDLQRDKLVQDRLIELAKIAQTHLDQKIKQEQQENDRQSSLSAPTKASGKPNGKQPGPEAPPGRAAK